jgi:iron complex outermembrane receptor protein
LSTAGYYLLGLQMGGTVKFGTQPVDVFISGSNMLNKTYLDHLSLFRAFGVNQIGRNIALNVRVPF